MYYVKNDEGKEREEFSGLLTCSSHHVSRSVLIINSSLQVQLGHEEVKQLLHVCAVSKV